MFGFPFTVGVTYAMSLLFPCGKGTKGEGPGQCPGISDVSRGNYLYLTGSPLRASHTEMRRPFCCRLSVCVHALKHNVCNFMSLHINGSVPSKCSPGKVMVQTFVSRLLHIKV